MSAISFSACFGVVPGYAPSGDHQDPAAPVVAAWHDAMDAEFASSGIVVGGIVSAARVVYPRSFGCPPRGEAVAKVEGTSNPEFSAARPYKAAVRRVVAAVKAALHQERVTLVFTPVATLDYLIPERERQAKLRGVA